MKNGFRSYMQTPVAHGESAEYFRGIPCDRCLIVCLLAVLEI